VKEEPVVEKKKKTEDKYLDSEDPINAIMKSP
jgi:hypothetical protein